MPSDAELSHSGHRVLPHTADVIVEAWGATLCECLGQAVEGLSASFIESADVVATRSIPIAFGPSAPEDLLLQVLEEVIYALDVLDVVPVTAVFEEVEGGGVAGSFEVISARDADVIGAIPKAVSLSGLDVHHDGVWRASATIDV